MEMIFPLVDNNSLGGFPLVRVFICRFHCTFCSVHRHLPVIKGLLDKLQASVKEFEGEESVEGIQQHYQNTLAHITHTKANDSSLYADVEV